jgi:hypothetical protein
MYISACTLGNFPLPTVVDDAGRFTVDGSYTLRAYPIAVGPPLPAVFTGAVSGTQLTFSVAVDDTVEKKLVPLGPANGGARTGAAHAGLPDMSHAQRGEPPGHVGAGTSHPHRSRSRDAQRE